jgi:hypothetical protein
MSTLDPDDRAAWIDGLVALACFLEAHPDLPVPESYSTQVITVFSDGTDAEQRAAVDAAAAVLGVTASDPHGHGHYKAARQFGPLGFEFLAISHAASARFDARYSYHDSITLNEDAQVAA